MKHQNKLILLSALLTASGLIGCSYESAHWTGSAGACTCTSGYVAVGGVCVPKRTCDTTTEKYDEATNTCIPTSTTHNIGDIVTFGHYEQDNDTTNGKEPIEWRVLDKNAAGQYLLISEKTLDVNPYNTTWISITWEKSTIQSWLNGYAGSYTSDNFIDAAFTAEEKAKIVTSNVTAHANPVYRTSPGNDTTDKIFLLSTKEAEKYLPHRDDRRAAATQSAQAKGVSVHNYTNFQYSSYWWLRSPGQYSNDAVYVDYDGGILVSGDVVYRNDIAVRPALWVNH